MSCATQDSDAAFRHHWGMSRSWTGLLVAVITAIAYAALLGWDTGYQTDPVTGEISGPYQAWQVITLALVIGALAAWAGWNDHLALALLVIPTTLVIAFLVLTVRGQDETGLFIVGALLLLIGSAVGVGIAGGLAAGVARRGGRA